MADVGALYRWQPSFVLGFHGTDKSVVDAVVAQPRVKVLEPSAVGAIIDLGYCLDLTTISGLEEVRQAFEGLRNVYEQLGLALPKNSGGRDRVKRELDCAVIQALHQYRRERGLAPYDSIRAPFPEEDDLYDGSGFLKKNHIQVCVINTKSCIKGYFKPIQTAQ